MVAYYPTRVPLHHRSQWLADRDPFGELVKAARGLGMVVWARLDPHAAHEDFYQAHPDWFEHDQDGNVLRHWVMPEMYLTCRLGPYNFEHMPRVVEEVLTSLDRDVRDRLGIESSPATSLSSPPELVEGPAAPEAPRGKSLDPSWTKAR